MRTAILVVLSALLPTHMLALADVDQLQLLRNDIQSADTETAVQAIKGLRESRDIRAVPPLLAAVRDERVVVRQYAVEALQHLVRTLDKAHFVAKRWLQSLIDQLRSNPPDSMVTTARCLLTCSPKKHSLTCTLM